MITFCNFQHARVHKKTTRSRKTGHHKTHEKQGIKHIHNWLKFLVFAVTLESQRRYARTAMPLRYNGNAILT